METDLINSYPIVSENKLVGIITRTDILKVEPSKRTEKTVADVMSGKILTVYPDEDLFSALIRMISNGVGRLPVVRPDNHESLIGIITRSDIAKAIEKHRSTQSLKRQETSTLV
jgi:CIC family chloride channel protein